MYDNILNINKTLFAFTFITFTIQNFKKQNKIISQLVSDLFLLLLHLLNFFPLGLLWQEILDGQKASMAFSGGPTTLGPSPKLWLLSQSSFVV